MSYRIEVKASVLKSLRRMSASDQARIRGAIALLAADPRPPGCKKLRGRQAWRVRVGDYRIIYTIEDQRLLVVVVATGHRREIYRNS